MKIKLCGSLVPGRAFACVALLLLVIVAWTPRLRAQSNLIFNGDFSQGNTGFQSQYTYVQVPYGVSNGQYGIGPNPSQFSSGWSAFSDHTGNRGNMLSAQGTTAPDLAVWAQTATGLVAGDEYVFQMFATTNWGSGPSQNLAVLQLATDGTRIGTPVTMTVSPGLFQRVTATFTATGSSMVLQIFDNNTGPAFNDFSIDDISLVKTVPEPSACTAVLAASAVVGAGLLGRRHRRIGRPRAA